MFEQTIVVDGRSIRLRESGDPHGTPVLYFHGTPGSRLDTSFVDTMTAVQGVRLIAFDRPGYGGSDPAPYSLRRIAEVAEAVADRCGIEEFGTLGWSGGGPFALATAAVLPKRVKRVAVVSGPGPFQQVPGASASLSADDHAALALLPHDPVGAAERMRAGSEILLAFRDDEATFMAGMADQLGPTDAKVLADPAVRHGVYASMREALRQGVDGIGWDNVAWVGPWDVDITAIDVPVRLWYGDQDTTIPLAHGRWLAGHLKRSELEVMSGEGHLGLLRHWAEVVRGPR